MGEYGDLCEREAEVQVKYATFTALLTECVTGATPLKRVQAAAEQGFAKAPPNRWWNKECDKSVRLRNAALMSFKYNRSYETFIAYKKTDATVKIGLKKIKRRELRAIL